MCVILYNETGKALDTNLLKVAYDNNPHGVGFMWVEDERVNILKGLYDFDQVLQVAKMFTGLTYSLHFRWRTKGKIAEEQCHPFTVLEKDKHGMDLALMHNGTIFSMPTHKKKSDTEQFCEKLRDKIIENDPEYELNYFDKLEKNVGKLNKIVVMTSDNRTFFLNKDQGQYIDGIWYSNTYSLEKDYRKNEKKVLTYTPSYKYYSVGSQASSKKSNIIVTKDYSRTRRGKFETNKESFYL